MPTIAAKLDLHARAAHVPGWSGGGGHSGRDPPTASSGRGLMETPRRSPPLRGVGDTPTRRQGMMRSVNPGHGRPPSLARFGLALSYQCVPSVGPQVPLEDQGRLVITTASSRTTYVSP